MRVVVFAMPGRLAGPALLALLEAGAEVVAVVVPAPPGAPPLAPAPPVAPPDSFIGVGQPPPPGPLQVAAARGLPALAVGRRAEPALATAIAAYRPDLACVLCWPWRIPPALLAVPRLGFLNLHPAPLPELRGPEPLFWAFQEGRRQTAVTLHWMDEQFDTGDIAARAPVSLPAGIGWDAAEERVAVAGAALLQELVPRLASGEVPRRQQGPGGSYRGSPVEEDFAIEPGWPAERAFRFMRGTAAWGRPYRLRADGAAPVWLGAAINYDPVGVLGASLTIEGALARAQLSPGVLSATLARR
jgi:methionyl-tRNA formyltransferase